MDLGALTTARARVLNLLEPVKLTPAMKYWSTCATCSPSLRIHTNLAIFSCSVYYICVEISVISA